MNKNLSQNFLINKNTIKNIIFYLDLHQNESIIEIGSGNGNVTKYIIPKVKHITCVEIDYILLERFKNINHNYHNINYIHQDFLKFKFIQKYDKLFSSIPYHITKPIIYKILKNYINIEKCYIIIPDEIRKKIMLSKNTFISFFIRLFFRTIRKKIFIKNINFFPIPKIHSSLIEICDKTNFTLLTKYKFNVLLNYCKLLFRFRRKKIKFNLKKILQQKFTKYINIFDSIQNKRIENLSFFESKILLINILIIKEY